jgi:2-polyprenyl-3-methyl-5-hydroxy-6-metoxy-1,4-benzoquinol methylase
VTTNEARETEAARVNRAYYEVPSAGREDYWRLMAAPRARVARILSLVREEPIRSLVDLGCGGGMLLREIEARLPGMELAGLDLSYSQIEANRRGGSTIRWEVADLEKPLAGEEGFPGPCDVVVASEILEHLDDAETFLRNALRLATPGRGRLILTTQSGPVRETERRVGHRRHFTRDSLALLLSDAGWARPRVWNEVFPFHDLSKWWANRDPDSSVRRFGERHYGPTERLVCALLRGAFALNSRARGAQLYAVARNGLES